MRLYVYLWMHNVSMCARFPAFTMAEMNPQEKLQSVQEQIAMIEAIPLATRTDAQNSLLAAAYARATALEARVWDISSSTESKVGGGASSAGRRGAGEEDTAVQKYLLNNIDGSLLELNVPATRDLIKRATGVREYVKQSAEALGLGGSIQRVAGSHVEVVVYGASDAVKTFDDFLDDLVSMKIVAAVRWAATKDVKVPRKGSTAYCQFNILPSASSQAKKGAYSSDAYDKVSEYSADHTEVRETSSDM